MHVILAALAIGVVHNVCIVLGFVTLSSENSRREVSGTCVCVYVRMRVCVCVSVCAYTYG